ncbi:MAG: PIN domain-containing protein [Nanoarchaeota archaeon]
MLSYYIDTCIYLNLWQKEESYSGVEYWKAAQKFLEMCEEKKEIIYYSGFILKELSFILNKREFVEKKVLFEGSPNFKRVILSDKELSEARKIEEEVNFEVSFYDIIHMILARKTNSILVTRDKRLMKISKKYNVNVKLPEELIFNK